MTTTTALNMQTPIHARPRTAAAARQAARDQLAQRTNALLHAAQPEEKQALTSDHRHRVDQLARHEASAGNLAYAQQTRWKPILNRDAVAPASLLLAHHGIRFWMLSLENKISYLPRADNVLRAVATQGLVSTVVCHTMLWALAEALRLGAEPMMRRWEQTSYDRALTSAREANTGNVHGWAVTHTRNAIDAAVATQAPEETREAVRTTFSTASDLLSLAVFFTTLGPIVGMLSPLTFFGPALGVFLLSLRSAGQARLAREEKDADNRLRACTAKFSDNVMLGNAHNVGIWRQEAEEAQQALASASWRRGQHKFWSEMALIGINGASIMGPFMATVHRQELRAFGTGSSETMREVVGGLPRLLGRFNGICHRSIDLTNDWNALVRSHGALHQVQKTVLERDGNAWKARLEDMLGRRDGFTITCKGPGGTAQPVSIDELLSNPRRLLTAGRWTVRARNGSGKTTLLNALSCALPGQVHYVPVKHTLSYRAEEGSAGQTQIRQLAEVMERVRVPVLFLDEWPANLDVPNTRGIDAILAEFSRHLCIVEVRND